MPTLLESEETKQQHLVNLSDKEDTLGDQLHSLTPLKVAVVYGGSDIRTQISELVRGPQIVIGTPGRTLDLIKRNKLRVNEIRWVVLDEADEMLSMGFKDDLDAILENSPKEKQTLLFSATMPREIVSISKKYMIDIHEISVGKRNRQVSLPTVSFLPHLSFPRYGRLAFRFQRI